MNTDFSTTHSSTTNPCTAGVAAEASSAGFFSSDTLEDGVRAREFAVDGVRGVLWSPAAGPAPAASPSSASSTPPASSVSSPAAGSAGGGSPLVLLGHGGGNHRWSPAMSGRARLLVAAGICAVAIDAPGHGDRPRTAHDEREIAAMSALMDAGEPVGPVVVRYNAHLAERAVPEWRATLDALLGLPEFGPAAPVGYFGLAMGTAIGIPLVAAEPRIRAAVFGLFWPDLVAETARRITVPLTYMLQWDDEHITRDQGLALFDAFGSREKTLHANAGRHKEHPRFEAESAARFFTRHLVRGAAVSPAAARA